jgi:hypothetical protein
MEYACSHYWSSNEGGRWVEMVLEVIGKLQLALLP